MALFTGQIRTAPKGAIYICVDYERAKGLSDVALMLSRPDLQFVGLAWLRSSKWRGQKLPGIVLDRDALDHMGRDDFTLLLQAKASCLPPKAAPQHSL